MIPSLYKKDGTTKIGELNNCIECLVEEERNGIFEVSIIYPTTDSIFNSLEEENIIVCNANDTLLNQKFRIYMTRKLMSNKIEVFARHISFDLAYDTVNSIDITNQSCEYALNTIFRQSQFSTHYKGYSDIINSQNYKISMCNCIDAIAGKEGSIIDTYGTGAEILRDNTNIHVLNKRGHDNDVTIEYAKNLTGFELEEDTTDLITRIMPYAKYNNSETNEEIMIKANAVDSPLINNYSHPYISYIDYSDKFEEGETPIASKLTEFAKVEYRDNKVDMPKQNYKIEFIPLSKCVGYEGLEDKISLCDTVTIKDTRYGIDTKAKVIRTVFDVLKNRYESMELGEPRTTLGDIIGNSGSGEDGKPGPQGPQGEPGPQGPPGNIGDFPDSLPSTPVLSAKVYGFASIELSWTYENKVYYNYELYASKTKDFTPNVFDIIHAGQTSSFLFQAKPNETWYFRVCAINTHGNRTEFSSQIAVTTKKIDDLSNYVDNMAIGDALIGELNLGRGWVGELRGNYIDAKQLSVTDGNGKRTFDIDSFGNVNIAATNISMIVNGEEQGVVGQSQFIQNNKEFEFKIAENTSPNLMPNSSFEKEEVYTRNHPFILDWTKGGDGTYPATIDGGKAIMLYTNGGDSYFVKDTAIKIDPNTTYTISFYYCCTHGRSGSNYIFINGNPVNIPITYIGDRAWHRFESTFNTPSNVDGITAVRFGIVAQETCWILFDNVQIEKGERASKYRYKQNEVCNGVSFIDHEGMGVKHEDGSYTKMLSNGFKRYIGSTGYSYHYLTYIGKTQKLDLNPVTIQLPDDFKNKDFKVNLSIEEIANPEGWMVQSFQVLVQNIDNANATFQIYGGSVSQLYDGTQGTMKPTTISYTVTA